MSIWYAHTTKQQHLEYVNNGMNGFIRFLIVKFTKVDRHTILNLRGGKRQGISYQSRESPRGTVDGFRELKITLSDAIPVLR